MARTHELKIWPNYFHAVKRGDKTFELRRNDRDFQTGDTLVLREWDPTWSQPAAPRLPGDMPPLPSAPGRFTGAIVTAVVSYILHGNTAGLPDGFCIMGINQPIAGTREEAPDENFSQFMERKLETPE